MSFDPDGAAEGGGIFGLPEDESQAGVVLVPVPFEKTVSYGTGTARGPALILEASRQVDLFDVETGHPYRAGIVMRAPRSELAEATSEQMNAIVYEEVDALLEAGKLTGTIGGEHSISLGAIRAHAERFGPIGVLQLDAHADLREAYEGHLYSHASIMERVLAEVPSVTHLVQVGVRDLGVQEHQRIEADARIHTWFGPYLAHARLEGRLLQELARVVAALPPRVYVSFDIDGLDPGLCPGTGPPVPGGLQFDEAVCLLRMVAEQKEIVGFDLTEVAGGEWDGNVGARILYKLIGWALKSNRP